MAVYSCMHGDSFCPVGGHPWAADKPAAEQLGEFTLWDERLNDDNSRGGLNDEVGLV